ncbi:prolyl 4-hydroxylase [Andreprevotia lacus DSM 23236]|jgi:prolyl 4-hydroxylase|uniref:Prolyl 4-hydroxylase n=1 Tax=Andreprevotia lacus DSM 23236 TaxID=1121001 RepID=A0A1W1WWM5_9NEIS|nr:2OG-Fe(II) oxygenase [Andreprevotia lacus]SMC15970.1 prolyl 4-hydroxylase [Andreprevotia lacus DSM 23236]
MDKIAELSPEWQSWLQDNLARGCTPQSLVEVMVSHQFEPMFANAIVFHFSALRQVPAAQASEPSAGQRAAQTGYQYEAPRLAPAGNTIQTHDLTVRVVTRINKPYVVVLENVLTAEECDEMIRLSSDKLKRSMTVDPKTGGDAVIADRTSYGAFFAINENPLIANIDRRLAELMSWPVENGEGIQILNYKVGGEYKPHFDYFPPSDEGSKVHLGQGGQRISTLVMYLNDVPAGGETIFPELGLAVAPKKGSAVYFEYCNSLDQVDPLTLHGGNPVIEGEKWIATKWLRQHRYGG